MLLKERKAHYEKIAFVINKEYFSKAFLFKPPGGRSPPYGLNSKPRKNPLFCLEYGAGANKHMLLSPLTKFTFAPPCIRPKLSIILSLQVNLSLAC